MGAILFLDWTDADDRLALVRDSSLDQRSQILTAVERRPRLRGVSEPFLEDDIGLWLEEGELAKRHLNCNKRSA